MDEPPETKVAHDGPAELDDLLFTVVLAQLVEEVAVDVLVVDDQAFGVVQGRLFSGCEVLVAPGRDLSDGLLVEGLRFP